VKFGKLSIRRDILTVIGCLLGLFRSIEVLRNKDGFCDFNMLFVDQ